ncbi:hypothetical protein V7266_10910 [Neobacillus drentensis]
MLYRIESKLNLVDKSIQNLPGQMRKNSNQQQ